MSTLGTMGATFALAVEGATLGNRRARQAGPLVFLAIRIRGLVRRRGLTFRLEVATSKRSQLLDVEAKLVLFGDDDSSAPPLAAGAVEDGFDQLRVDGVQAPPEPVSVGAGASILEPLIGHALGEFRDANRPDPELADGKLGPRGDVKVLDLVVVRWTLDIRQQLLEEQPGDQLRLWQEHALYG